MLRIAGEDIDPLVIAVTFAIGIAGGFAFRWIGTPLPMLLGSVVTVGCASLLGFRTWGRPPKVPMWLRHFFVPIIGLSIGGAFTPAILADALTWWPTLAALFVYIPLVHWLGFQGYRRIGRLDPRTAYYSAVPGGLIEVIAMGEEAGADARMLTALQFMRLILTILLVPLAFSILQGSLVGSSSGAVLARGGSPDLAEAVFLVVLGVTGYFGGRALRFPAYVITGPLAASGIAHLLGLIDSIPPSVLIEVTQLVIGVALGTRFVGMSPRAFFKALSLSFVNILGTMVIAVVLAVLLHRAVGQRSEAVTLAFAPGGLAEMSLVAVSLEISVVYVTTHHVMRIVLSVAVARLFAGRIGRTPREPGPSATG